MEKEELNKLYQLAKSLLGVHKSLEAIELHLNHQSADPKLISEVIERIKKERLETKNKQGIIKIMVGGFFLVSSFVITCVNFHSNQPFVEVMYGFTSLGAVLVFWGLYDVFN